MSHVPVSVVLLGDLQVATGLMLVWLVFLGAPVALGSWWGLVFFFPILELLIWRLEDEERYLSNNLPGYQDYCARVTYRLIPSIW